MRKRSITIAAVAVAAALGAGAGAASAAPVTRLPDISLFCGQGEILPNQWVVIPTAGTAWIKTGDLAGHYVILESAHYWAEGILEGPPLSYDGFWPLGEREFGQKTGLRSDALHCDFVSRWDFPGSADDFSVVGPMIISKVSR